MKLSAALLVLAFLVHGAARGHAADAPAPPVRAGLEFWIDAAAQRAPRQARFLPAAGQGDALDLFFDASGRGRHLAQRTPAARPRLHTGGGVAFVRFDGKDDALSAGNLGGTLTNATVFILAAPRSNTGLFRGFFAINRTGRNDYTSGLNVDLGGGASSRFDTLNLEGAGFGGAADVMDDAFDFGGFHVIAVVCGPGAAGVKAFVDGRAQRTRPREPALLGFDEITVGARCYSNTAEPAHTQSHLEGDIAEILLYDRALPDAEREAVEKYLLAKIPALTALAAAAGRVRGGLVTVTNPPPVQMFIPGFSVRALPLDLPNINNLKYRADGRLVAAGYNGRVYLLTDTDGDGLEDRAETFWDGDSVRAPIGMALTPPGYALGQGVFLPGKGKVSLLVDTNGDDRADREILVATWTEPGEQHGVDALGAAVGRDGSVYFGLGCASFTGAYLIDKTTGRSRYDLKSERGTILKVAPDFSRREIVCTGIRFPVAMAFNGAGDLFCTDQEGATWLPNGNPLDELLHIQPGRHYGFPPRHPKHLPGVIDEPSVFDYAPQHQSTCGLNFNEAAPGGRVFGPAGWQGDAFVTGYSRGKLYRTKLVKTAASYVARNQLIASLPMLPADACVSPRGDLVIAAHSGQPDWGSGPQGKGKLYQIRQSDADAPQPVLAWAASPTETRVTFDRPLDATRLKNLARQARMEAGEFVGAGDRFEVLRPGYQVVKDQIAAAREEIAVQSAAISPDGRTLTLVTTPRVAPVNYALTISATAIAAKAAAGTALPQHDAVDLCHDLSGVEAHWRAAGRGTNWTGWLPHADMAVARAFTEGSAEHERLWRTSRQPGTLVLRGQLDLRQMLLPAVQPGSQLDHEPSAEKVTVTFQSASPLKLRADSGAIARAGNSATLTVGPHGGTSIGFEIELETGGEPSLSVAWHTAEDARLRAMPLRRWLVPWALAGEVSGRPPAPREIPELAGGHWLRGRRAFFSEQAACAKCHAVAGQGGRIGPDLSNLVHRDYASVLKDLREPSAALNPDHLASHLELNDGETLTGVLVSDTAEHVELADASGKVQVVPRRNVRAIRPSTVSLMPEGIDAALGPEQLRDLLTFLLTRPLEPAPLEAPNPPPPRARAELAAVLGAGAVPPVATKPLRILLVAGPKDHGPGEHDYPLWQKRWAKLLVLAENVTVTTAMGWPGPEQFAAADVAVFYSNNGGWSLERAAEIAAFQQRGGGLAYLHYAVDGHRHVEALSGRIGLAWQGGHSRFRHGALDLKFHDAAHPVSRGFNSAAFVDESYWNLIGDPKHVHLLASGVEEGAARPLIWTREEQGRRVFVSILGHYSWTFDDPLFRVLVLRGLAWAAGQPAERLEELADVGARVQ